MRRLLLAVVAVTAVCGSTYLPNAAADTVRVGINVIYRDLSPYGQWVHRASYGWVWVPDDVPVDWRPYTHGHWVYTDDYGWLWVSNWRWGWAPFHYGRWTYDDDYGWVWIPGTVWAPAWVTWRYGDGWVGWAPMPPAAVWRPTGGFGIRITLVERDIRPSTWVFVRDRDFVRPHLVRYAQMPARNVILIDRTRNATRYRFDHDRIVNAGIRITHIERAIGRPLPRYRVHEVDSIHGWRTHPVAARLVSVFRPRIAEPRGAHPAPPPALRGHRRTLPSRPPGERRRRELLQDQQRQKRRIEERYRRELRKPLPAGADARIRRDRQRELQALQREHRRQEILLEHRMSRDVRRPPPAHREPRGGERPPPYRGHADRRHSDRGRQEGPN